MELCKKIVSEIPLDDIWSEEKEYKAQRKKYLTKNEIKEILKSNSTQFIIANIGDKLLWIDKQENYKFWKEAQKNITDEDVLYLEDYLNEYVYVASEWEVEEDNFVILLEKYH